MPTTVTAASADNSANANRAAAVGGESTAALAVASTAGKPTSASAIVTPSRGKKPKRGSPLASSPGSLAKSATQPRAIALAAINFHSRNDAVAALASLTGSDATVPKTLHGIIQAILAVYSVSELKPFWTHTFGVDVVWPNRKQATTKLVTALAIAGVSRTTTESKPPTVPAT